MNNGFDWSCYWLGVATIPIIITLVLWLLHALFGAKVEYKAVLEEVKDNDER